MTGPKQLSEAVEVVSQVREAHVPLIEKALDETFAKDLEAVPECLRMALADDMRREFLLNHFIPIVRGIVVQVSGAKSFRWQPPLDIEDLPDQTTRDSARE